MRHFTHNLMGAALLAVLGTTTVQAQTHTWADVNTGDGTTYAIESDGTLWSWGWNESGQMGINGGATKCSTPTQVGSDADWKSSCGGQAYAFFIKNDGTLWAVGDNSEGVSGVGDGATNHKVPVQVGTDADWASVSCSRFYGHSALALKTDGTLWSWGDGRLGQLGLGSYSSQSTPVQVGTDTDWAQVSVGNNFTIALKTDGSLWGWGVNQNKPLMNSAKYVNTPTQLGTDTDWAYVFAVVETAYGVKKDGTLWVWGANDNNMAGINDADIDLISSPAKVSLGANEKVVAISGSDYNRYVGVGENGVITKIYSWGSNSDGALGDGSGVAVDAESGIKTITTPVVVKLPEGVQATQLASGIGHCVVLSTDGKIYGWGKNRAGQLGNYCPDDQMTFIPNPIQCAVQSQDEDKVYTIDAADIPAQLQDAKKLILTGVWSTSSFQALTGAIGNNTGFPPAGNSTIEEIDMSQAQIAAGTYAYVAYGMSSYGVFRGLKALTKVTMPAAEEAANFKSLRSIFQNCTSLTDADISDCVNVTNITDAFYGCAITEADLSKLTKITSCESAFDNCASLKSVKLPGNITLDKYFFGSNEALTTIDWSTFEGTEAPKMPNYLFQYVTDLKSISLIVPEDAVASFKADESWGQLNVVAATSTGINGVSADRAANGIVYTIGGVKVSTGSNDISSMAKGLYIVNGKKVLVK